MAIAIILGLVFMGLVALAAVFAFRPRKVRPARVSRKPATPRPSTPSIDPDAPTEQGDPDATGLPASVRSAAPAPSAFAGTVFEAAAAGDVEALKSKIAGSGSLSRLGQLDEHGWTALHHAAYNDQIDAVRWLLDQGADTEAVAEGECVPMHMAAAQAGPEVAALLLERGADPLKSDDQGSTALHYAMRSGRGPVVDVLLDGGVPIDFKDASHLTALDRARLEGLTDLEARLKDRGARSGTDVRMVDLLAELGPAGAEVPVPEGWQLQPDSPELQKARDTAQSKLFRLLEAFDGGASPKAAVRFVLREGDLEELVWGTVVSANDERVEVVLQAPPLALTMPSGPIEVTHIEVVDWQLLTERGTIGGFGEKATGEAMQREYGRMSPAIQARLAQRVEV